MKQLIKCSLMYLIKLFILLSSFLTILTKKFICKINSDKTFKYILGLHSSDITERGVTSNHSLSIMFEFESKTELEDIQSVFKAIYDNNVINIKQVPLDPNPNKIIKGNFNEFKFYKRKLFTPKSTRIEIKSRNPLNNHKYIRKVIRKHRTAFRGRMLSHNTSFAKQRNPTRLTTTNPSDITALPYKDRNGPAVKRLLCGHVSRLDNNSALMVAFCKISPEERDRFFALYEKEKGNDPLLFYYNSNSFRNSFFEKDLPFGNSDNLHNTESMCLHFEQVYVDGVMVRLSDLLLNLVE